MTSLMILCLSLVGVSSVDESLRAELLRGMPSSGFVQIISHHPERKAWAAYGYDFGASTTWYEFSNGIARAHFGGDRSVVTVVEKTMVNAPTPGPINPAIEYSILPRMLVHRVLRHPECITRLSREADGTVTLRFSAPWGMPGMSFPEGSPILNNTLKLDAAGDVVSVLWNEDEQGDPRPIEYIGRASNGVRIGAAGSGWTLMEAEVVAINTAELPEIFEEVVRWVRELQSGERVAAARQATAEPTPVRLKSGQSVPAKADPLVVYSRAVWITGIILVVIGGVLWWRRGG